MFDEERSKKLKWMRFYVNWRFPIGFVLGAMTILGNYGDVLIKSKAYQIRLPGYFYVFLAIDVFVYFFRIVVYKNMRKMEEKGYYQNVVLLFVEVIVFATALYQPGKENGAEIAIAVVLGLLVWFIPNYVYFKRRAFLFTGICSIDELNSLQYNEDIGKKEYKPKMYFCTACGERSALLYWTCPKCGAVDKMREITEEERSIDKPPECIPSMEQDEETIAFDEESFVNEEPRNSTQTCNGEELTCDRSLLGYQGQTTAISNNNKEDENMSCEKETGSSTLTQDEEETSKSERPNEKITNELFNDKVLAVGKLEVKFCRICGGTISKNSRACSKCGTQIKEVIQEKAVNPKEEIKMPATARAEPPIGSLQPPDVEGLPPCETSESASFLTQNEEDEKGKGDEVGIEKTDHVHELCGEKRDDPFMFCRKCGGKIPVDSTFCPKCGEKVVLIQ